jgi:hypothetical protein
VIDPISTCLSWANNADQYDCTGVTAIMPGPGTGSKCNCEPVAPDPPILIYRGYDWGDLPDKYGMTTLASGGARHSIQDPNNDGTPETMVTTAAVWLGATVDFSPNAESDGLPGLGANGDDGNYSDDEDGVTPNEDVPWGPTARFSVSVSSSDGTCEDCWLGIWIDWDTSGTFESSEGYDVPVSVGAQVVSVNMPPTIPAVIYARFRLYRTQNNGGVNGILPTGLVVNGEVEDYVWSSPPTAVDMLPFKAMGADSAIVLLWQTTDETDNLGFNVYRSTSASGPRVKLNEELIPSLVAPGSPVGAAYEYTDAAVKAGKTYYYWLEDVDIFGKTGLYGPVDAKLNHMRGRGLPPNQPTGEGQD